MLLKHLDFMVSIVLKIVARPCGFLQFPKMSWAALDPCIGDGVTFTAITADPGVLRYGIIDGTFWGVRGCTSTSRPSKRTSGS